MNWKEFKPTILFLSKFLGLYLAGNLLYGIYVTGYKPTPDPATRLVTQQTSWCLSMLGWTTTVADHPAKPTTAIIFESKSILTVYEGCNGLNVMIIFIAFIVAFGPLTRGALWFALIGIVVIHLSNLLRIGLLFIVSIKMPDYWYISHKYLFTAFIYGFVLLLWMIWVRFYSLKKP